VFTVGLGVVGLPWLSRNIYTFLGAGAERPTGLNTMILLQSDILAVAGILAAGLIYGLRLVKPETMRRAAGPVYTVLLNKFYIDEFYMLLIRGIFFTVTSAIAWFDRHVVDGAVNLVGWLSKKGGDLLRRTMAGKVQGYALIVFCGVLVAIAVLLFVNFGGGR
jgi:NADH-quinone oxidoreductase subunit L